jgi:endonuclease/exonuclease/phosphatase family metal-dependent hydrolase
MSCNIRKSDANDKENAWAKRRDVCLAVVQAQNADIICIQEMRDDQFRDFLAALPRYGAYGLTKTADCRHPINTIFYRRERFERVAAGGYWLSATPHVPGSRSWGSASIRLANWLRLQDRKNDSEFRIINTHLDHVSDAARVFQIGMIIEDAKAYPRPYPQILTGDLNVNRHHRVIQNLKSAGWQDSILTVQRSDRDQPTYHGFLGDRYTGAKGRIDWILYRGCCHAQTSEVVRDHAGHRYPSDHYFMSSEISLEVRAPVGVSHKL